VFAIAFTVLHFPGHDPAYLMGHFQRFLVFSLLLERLDLAMFPVEPFFLSLVLLPVFIRPDLLLEGVELLSGIFPGELARLDCGDDLLFGRVEFFLPWIFRLPALVFGQGEVLLDLPVFCIRLLTGDVAPLDRAFNPLLDTLPSFLVATAFLGLYPCEATDQERGSQDNRSTCSGIHF
jgi:hypothetical protein